MATASVNSITTLLTQSNDSANATNADGFTSNGVMLMVGGAREAFLSRPNTYRIVLKQRKGFVRIALKTGSAIVPVISFGETNVFEQNDSPPGSYVRKIQELIKRYTGIAPILFNGRGLFQYSFGLIPKRHPITTIIGAPMELEKILNPTPEEIDDVHEKFCKKLQELFDTHKSNYLENWEKIELEIL